MTQIIDYLTTVNILIGMFSIGMVIAVLICFVIFLLVEDM
tara:strand:- start:1362 stop:1481 length:120 start_codon:yes stop_codon:yes gene_type:complete